MARHQRSARRRDRLWDPHARRRQHLSPRVEQRAGARRGPGRDHVSRTAACAGRGSARSIRPGSPDREFRSGCARATVGGRGAIPCAFPACRTPCGALPPSTRVSAAAACWRCPAAACSCRAKPPSVPEASSPTSACCASRTTWVRPGPTAAASRRTRSCTSASRPFTARPAVASWSCIAAIRGARRGSSCRGVRGEPSSRGSSRTTTAKPGRRGVQPQSTAARATCCR